MAQISARTAAWAKWAVVPVALLVGGVAVSQASYSAFSATAASPENSWKAGTVALSTDAERATATLTAENLKPGSGGVKCMSVTSTGSLASAVKLYASKVATTNALSSWIDVTITEGNGAGADCGNFVPLPDTKDLYSGRLAAVNTTAIGFGTGLGTWAPTGKAAETRTYKITYTLNADAPNTTQEGTASVGFTWEAQNS